MELEEWADLRATRKGLRIQLFGGEGKGELGGQLGIWHGTLAWSPGSF